VTLIIALKSRDGIVMAADGQEAIETGSGVIRAQVAKVNRLGRTAAWGGSGDVTFIQRAQRALDRCVAEKGEAHFRLPADIDLVSDAIVEVLARLLDQANATAAPEERETPTDDRDDAPTGELLLSDFSKGVGRIYQVDSRGFETEVDARFAAIGLADVAAYSLLRPLTDEDLAAMTAAEASLVAYGMIRDASELSAEVGPPVQLWVVDADGPREVVGCSVDAGERTRLETAWTAYSSASKALLLDSARQAAGKHEDGRKP
jgi:20S proteasome alpha/beta subunit